MGLGKKYNVRHNVFNPKGTVMYGLNKTEKKRLKEKGYTF